MAVRFDLAGKFAVVAGGAGGIGQEVAARLVECGASVWVWDLNCSDSTTTDRHMNVDLTDSEQVSAAVEHVMDDSGRIDILVNCAGTLGRYVAFDDLSPDEWRRVIDTNLASVLETCNRVVPHMRAARAGRIVNFGSLAAKHGLPSLAAYSAASGGVVAFTKALAQELVAFGVYVNCIAPGPIETSLITDLGQAVVDSIVESSPMKRLGSPAEVADLVLWLCSDSCTFSTGAVFDVSGGRAAY